MKPVYKFLKKARSLVDAGWVKGTYQADGSYCAIGAVCHVDETDTYGYSIYNEALNRLQKALPRGHHGIVAFNDAKKTTKQDVLDLFTRAMRASR